MCGILGIACAGGSPSLTNALQRSLDVIRHRGPDDEGWALLDTRCQTIHARPGPMAGVLDSRAPRDGGSRIRWNVAIGHRRLAILDPGPCGHQPMASPDGRYWITYNGEVYNYPELRLQLEARGHVFRTGTDTEVVLAAYAEWGPRAFARFVGMFALAIADVRRNRLTLARDPYGIKPLYYTEAGYGIAFASEPKALLELPGVSRRANPSRVYRFLRAGVTDYGGETLFAEIRQVQGGHFAEIDCDRPCQLWTAPFCRLEEPDDGPSSFPEAVDAVRDRLRESVGMHLRSDVPVGACLSGGIDSSAIVSLVRALRGSRLGLHTFSYVTDAPGIGEEWYADVVGCTTGSVMHKTRPTAEEMAADLDHLVYVQDEPFISTSIYAQYRVFQAAREAGVKVMLDGQGADETFAGYAWYYALRVAGLVRQGHVAAGGSLLERARRDFGLSGRATLRGVMMALMPQRTYDLARHIAARSGRPGWLNEGWFAERNVALADCSSAPHQLRDLRSALRASQTETSLPTLLRYEDRNSMAFSVESRVPFIVPSLMGLAPALPESCLIDDAGTSKAVLRQALRGAVPNEILDRRGKIGFQTPEGDWAVRMAPWIDSMLANGIARTVPALDLPALRNEWTAVREQRAPFRAAVWRSVSLLAWARRFQVSFE